MMVGIHIYYLSLFQVLPSFPNKLLPELQYITSKHSRYGLVQSSLDSKTVHFNLSLILIRSLPPPSKEENMDHYKH